MYVYVCECECVSVCVHTHQVVEVAPVQSRRQLTGLGSLLPPTEVFKLKLCIVPAMERMGQENCVNPGAGVQLGQDCKNPSYTDKTNNTNWTLPLFIDL